MSELDLGRRVILITGGCGAIGRHIVSVLAAHNALIAVNDIVNTAEAEASFEDAGVDRSRVQYFQRDVTDPSAVKQLLRAVEQDFGQIDVVCAHAGLVDVHPLQEYPVESWVQDVPWPDIGPYNASKAALRSLMRGFARETAGHGIRANAIAPGIVGVGLAKRQWDTDPSYRERARKAIPLGYMQPPESVANAFLFLCSDLSTYMTGSVLLVDGGTSLYPMD